jgi:phenylpyruvate tautomerase PptA (4-oxalocrotonate tautomerase family)
MPLTRISVPQHLPARQVRALADAVQAGLVSTCKVPVDDRFQLVSRFEADNMILNPTLGGMARTADACIVEITFLQGRTDAHKRALYRCVTDQAVAAGFKADDIMIALTENAPIDWTLGQGQAFKGHS